MLTHARQPCLHVFAHVEVKRSVEGAQDQREAASELGRPNVSLVELHPSPDPRWLAFQTRPKIVEHRPRMIDAGHLDAGMRERKRDPPVADAVLQDRARSRGLDDA
jgi:hypothetical protein